MVTWILWPSEMPSSLWGVSGERPSFRSARVALDHVGYSEVTQPLPTEVKVASP